MISGVQGLKIKPLAELKNDGIQKHTSIKSFSTVLSSQKKKAENTSASKAAKESAKSDSSNADTTVNKSSDSDSTAGKILYRQVRHMCMLMLQMTRHLRQTRQRIQIQQMR